MTARNGSARPAGHAPVIGLLACSIVAVAALAPPAFAQARAVDNRVASAEFRDSGGYRVRCRDTGWTLAGKLEEPPDAIDVRSGIDKLGPWKEVSARTRAEVATIRVYDHEPVVLFEERRIVPGLNVGIFPTFAALPPKLMKLGYGVNTFARHEFGQLGAEGPWVLFDEARNTMVLSPADHFLVADMAEAPGGVSAGGLDPRIATVPAGFEHRTVLALGKGIGAALGAWGHALQALDGKQPVPDDADPLLAKLGYWTDHGATYYYHFVPRLGYEGTLLAVRNAYRKLGVPIAYMQLDSWWYPKAKGNSLSAMAVNGETVYRANPKIFPRGLRAFERQMRLPFAVHARWVDAHSPYRREYRMSRNVVLSRAFWRKTARYLHDGGVVVYEQDWLSKNARPAVNLTDPRQFLGNMAHAMAREGIAIQYCMPLPGYFLASTRYQNVETIRVSGDRFMRSQWDQFLYGSMLAHAVGLWPWSDVFMSRQLPELILSTLSAGPVGVGDALGQIDASNLRRAMRSDSVLLKPDVPIQPLDASILADAAGRSAPMVAATHSADEVEVFAYARAAGSTQATVSLRELGIRGPAYLWNWVRRSGRLLAPGASFPMVFENGWAYDVVAPLGRDGIALLGDPGKIVPLAGKRFPVATSSRVAHLTIAFAAGEKSVTVTGYASKRPTVRRLRGSLGPLDYSAATHLFRIAVHPATSGRASGSAQITIGAGARARD
jgi:hypothetical protein